MEAILAEMGTEVFWAGLGQIILINIILSGDNAVVIALASRSLPPRQQKQAIFWGSGAAIAMRIVLTIFAVAMLQWPWLKLIGAVLLLWIGIKLLLPEEGHGEIEGAGSMAGAIRTILIADLVMSLDNVIAVAAAAKDSWTLIIIGLLISIPLVIFGSQLLLKVMERFPIIITIGAALLGFVAGEMAATDPAIRPWLAEHFVMAGEKGELAMVGPIALKYISGAFGAIFVVLLGKYLLSRRAKAKLVDLANKSDQPAGGH